MTPPWTASAALVVALVGALGGADVTRVHSSVLAFVEAMTEAEQGDPKEEEAYGRGTKALDEEEWEAALKAFEEVAEIKARRADAAWYWKAYAQNRAGRPTDALGSLAKLRHAYPQSRWLKEGRALEIEIRQASGQAVAPEAQGDEDLKLIALNSLLHTDSEKAMPLLEKFLAGGGSPKLRERALFVLSQSGSPQAREIVGRIARGQQHPDLQEEAIKYLGLFGGQASRQVLRDVYASTADLKVKKSILHSYMLAGEKAALLAAARGEKSDEMRKAAVHQLGLMSAQAELWELYHAEGDLEVKKAVLHAFFLGGGAERLMEVAKSDPNPELRRSALHSLGLMGGERTGAFLLSTYQSSADREIRKQVLHSLFLQGNARALIDIARGEKDPDLRKAAVHQLSLMSSREATEFLVEILNR